MNLTSAGRCPIEYWVLTPMRPVPITALCRWVSNINRVSDSFSLPEQLQSIIEYTVTIPLIVPWICLGFVHYDVKIDQMIVPTRSVLARSQACWVSKIDRVSDNFDWVCRNKQWLLASHDQSRHYCCCTLRAGGIDEWWIHGCHYCWVLNPFRMQRSRCLNCGFVLGSLNPCKTK